jgi:colanic acid/amylovoran biosynthesis glycosyltransferase
VKIAIVASVKKGMEHFIYREVSLLEQQGHEIVLLPTKIGKGLYAPKPQWNVQRWTVLGVALSQLRSFAVAPLTYLKLLSEAIRFHALVEFALAWHFTKAAARCDVIYSTFGDRKLFVGYFCKQIIGKPLAVTIHAYELYRNPNPELFQHALAACDQIITVTEYNRELLNDRYGIAPSRVEVVRINVDVAEYYPHKRFVVLIVGFFAERKGHDVLLDAVQKLGNSDIEVWVVGGEGAEFESVDVRRMVKERGLESQVAFFGALSGTALQAVYRAADVFCLPCRTGKDGVAEGFPTVLAEAMAFGKPVITTRHVEIPRIVRQIVVNENDVDGVANAIQLLYSSPDLCNVLGTENRKIAEANFSPRNALRTADVLASLIAADKVAPSLPSAARVDEQLSAER